MRKTLIKIVALIVFAVGGWWSAASGQNVRFDDWFTGGTLRVDCLREGSAMGDTVWVENWVYRPGGWFGSRTQMIDPFDNGDYRVEMRDAATGRVLYSRGYSNLFREYKDTPEGKTTSKQFQETLLLPRPKGKVLIALQKRDKETLKLFDQTVASFDPEVDELVPCFMITTATPDVPEPAVAYEIHGDPSVKLDVAFVMQGFDDDTLYYQSVCRRMAEGFFKNEPFRSHRNDFNLYFIRGNVGAEYNTFGSDRYLMTLKLWSLHWWLYDTPADHVIIVVNNKKYGGGAIYNFYSVTSLDEMAEYVLPHELGHGIGGLADEYVDEDLSYADIHRTSYEPLEPNITNLVDFQSKWQSLLPKGTPVPTPDVDVPRNENGPLGVYEGAGYSSKGVYRPAMHCMMRDYAPFCPVCRQRLEDIFKLYTR